MQVDVILKVCLEDIFVVNAVKSMLWTGLREITKSFVRKETGKMETYWERRRRLREERREEEENEKKEENKEKESI